MAARWLLALTALFYLLSASLCGAAQRNKIVFISDLHLNVDASYSWLYKHAGDLSKFLSDLYNREDVTELVILGDLVDDWVCPVKNAPNSFADVLSAPHNAGIVTALKALCAKEEIKVTYVVGNHDLLSYQDDNRAVLEDTFPGMAIISEEPGLGSYGKDSVIWAEHGHRYTMFNAPDVWSHAGGRLPLGYFISRLAASASISGGKVVNTPDLLDQYVKYPAQTMGQESQGEAGAIWDDAFVIAVFNAIALGTGHWPWSHFRMRGLDGYDSDPSVEGVAFTFDGIVAGWPSRQDRVTPAEAIWNDLGHLTSAANLIFEMPDFLKDKYPFTPRIILFGHTHQAEFQYHSGPVETIYVNTGTWIDGKPMTWAEIDISPAGGGDKVYQVSLWYYGETTPRHSGTIVAAAD